MYISKKFCSFQLTAASYNEALSKMYKQFIKINNLKPEKANFTFNVSKMENNSFLVTVYVQNNFKEEEARLCNCCKEMHTAFYINSRYNCDRCEFKTFKKRVVEKMNHFVRYFKKKL